MVKKCAVCGKEFDAEPTQRKFCSPKCQEIKHRQQNREWQQENRKKREPTCKLCGVNLENVRPNTKYCDDCRKKKHVQRNKNSHKKRLAVCNPPFGCFECKKRDCDQGFQCTEAERKFHEMAELPHGGTVDTHYILRIDDVICSLKGR